MQQTIGVSADPQPPRRQRQLPDPFATFLGYLGWIRGAGWREASTIPHDLSLIITTWRFVFVVRNFQHIKYIILSSIFSYLWKEKHFRHLWRLRIFYDNTVDRKHAEIVRYLQKRLQVERKWFLSVPCLQANNELQ